MSPSLYSRTPAHAGSTAHRPLTAADVMTAREVADFLPAMPTAPWNTSRVGHPPIAQDRSRRILSASRSKPCSSGKPRKQAPAGALSVSLARSSPVPEDSKPPKAQEPKTPPWQTVIGVVVLAALVAVAVLAVIQIYPHKLPTTANPSFVDNILDRRAVVLVVRVALIFAAGYIVISVVGLIVGRRWLSQLRPFRASDPIARLDKSAEALESDLQEAVDTIQDLEKRLVESDEALAKAQATSGPCLTTSIR